MIRHRIQAATLAFVAAAACVGPAAPAAPDGVYFPRFQAQDSMPGAAQLAVLRREGPCLLLVTEHETLLPFWSSDLRALDIGDGRIGIVDHRGVGLALEGQEATFGGAHYGPQYVDVVEGLVGQPFRPDCRRDGYYMVATIPPSR